MTHFNPNKIPPEGLQATQKKKKRKNCFKDPLNDSGIPKNKHSTIYWWSYFTHAAGKEMEPCHVLP
jgi:hypothetical protein